MVLSLLASTQADGLPISEVVRAQRERCPRHGVLQEIAVALFRDVSFEDRFQGVRTSGRLNSRVAVAVEWGGAGQRLRSEGYTVDIGAKGCLAIVPHEFMVGERLRLINLTNQISCEAVLVWRGHEGRTGWELGLELQEPPPDFWGLDF
jgi:PilZ domain